jgi:hypothetical protein
LITFQMAAGHLEVLSECNKEGEDDDVGVLRTHTRPDTARQGHPYTLNRNPYLDTHAVRLDAASQSQP